MFENYPIKELFFWKMGRQYTTLFLTEILREACRMKIKFFPDTDTALVEFSNKDINETIEVSENVYLDVDIHGNIVSMTIEHAREHSNLPYLSFQQIDNEQRLSA
ncbi:conserved hypothetical protein (DUF2283) [Desulfamplus magnetovallimortis]|uniref:Uncharacterized protein n=1 Tax=Desulfamplus magnetovallimortis TaxID=1246637 RepID=A0A1W1HA42_9BACT|nr:DUF2283 domain-containing protein [Desulfamplus magnetovallimortis]SLM29306.1 conserved hypothetical protein (DUF2283) [Desulfamplus magnetovallimortis]